MRHPRMLTVPQPWAWAIVHGHQPLYTHHEEVWYRGPVLLHSQRRDVDYWGYQRLREQGYPLPDMRDLWRGYIVGMAVLLDCLEVGSAPLPPELARWSAESGCNLLFAKSVPAVAQVSASGGAKILPAPRGWARAFESSVAG